MIRTYRERRHGSRVAYLPLIAVQLQSGVRSVEVNALVDSGAEHNVFRADLADRLEIDFRQHPEVTLVTVAGQTSGHVVPLAFQLGQHQWEAPVVFAKMDGHHLLGQQGFFQYFTVTFRYQKRDMSITKVNQP